MLRSALSRAFSLAALPLLAACAGCHHEAPAPPPPPPESGGATPAATDASADTVVHLEDDGKTFTLGAGAHLVLKLASNSGTGYAWIPAPVDATVLAQEGEREVERLGDAPGAPKLDVLRFVAKGAGTVTLEVDLKRPWGDQPVAKTVEVTVTVH